MIKYLVLGVFLWQEVIKDVYGQANNGLVDNDSPVFPGIIPSLKNDSSKKLIPNMNGNYNFYATHQIFYLSDASAGKNPTVSTEISSNTGRKLGSGYIETKGVGAHKVHIRKLTWNRARRICAEEGGHLAITRTEAEENIILRMMRDKGVEYAWIGYHDKFEEGDWITVLDEPLAQSGWSRWTKRWPITPDNKGGNEHCAYLLNDGGMNDYICEGTLSFVCKISF